MKLSYEDLVSKCEMKFKDGAWWMKASEVRLSIEAALAQQAQPWMPPEQDCIAAMQRAIREKGPDKSTSLELALAAYDAVLALFTPKETT